jgi:1-acyl-sn-glycerol-3-phosphate acyltransferase
MILMAVRSGVPIIPMYIKGRDHWYQRFQMIIGEPVDINQMYGNRPSFKQIEEITQYLFNQEEELKHKIEGKM